MNTESEIDKILELLHNSWFEDDYDPTDPDVIEAKAALEALIDREKSSLLVHIYSKRRRAYMVKEGFHTEAVHHKDIDYEYWRLTNESLQGTAQLSNPKGRQ